MDNTPMKPSEIREQIYLFINQFNSTFMEEKQSFFVEEFVNWIDNELDNAYIQGCNDEGNMHD